MLATLLMHLGKAMSKEELLRKVWGPEFNGDSEHRRGLCGLFAQEDRHSF